MTPEKIVELALRRHNRREGRLPGPHMCCAVEVVIALREAGLLGERDKVCDHCGRIMGNFDGGFGGLRRGGMDYDLCHPNTPARPDCYRLVTVYGEKIGSRIGQPYDEPFREILEPRDTEWASKLVASLKESEEPDPHHQGELMDANAALDRIAELVALDEDGVWPDESSSLESIANVVIATGRTVEGWGS